MKKMTEKLKQLRKDNNYTYKQLAEMLNISINHTWQLENGKCNVSLNMLDKICKVYNLTKIYFLDDSDGIVSYNQKISSFFYKFEKLNKKDKIKIEKIIYILLEK